MTCKLKPYISAQHTFSVTSVEQARTLLAQAKGSVELLVQHGREKNFVAIKLKP